MKKVRVKLKNHPYEIIIGCHNLVSLGRHIRKLKLGTDAYIVSNSAVSKRYAKALRETLAKAKINSRLKLVADSEKSKSFKVAAYIIKDLSRFDQKKQVFIIAFGGGVIGDLAGFVASIYKRGIPYIQVPTTLLAQVDSSIGGKTGLDLREGKNLLGAFYQPRLVLSDVWLLKTLDIRQLGSGLAEVIKYGIIKDPALFAYLEKKAEKISSLTPADWEFLVSNCSKIKAGIIEQDEREEKGIRTVLNFGHTIGHAIEAAAGYAKYNHGQGIALGMLVATEISVALGLAKKNLVQRIEGLLRAVGLPTQIKGVSLRSIIAAHYHDKKFTGSKNKLVLLRSLGKTTIMQNVPLEVIKEAIGKRIS